MFFIQERKEGEGSGDEDGATSKKLESDSDEDSESEEEVCYSLLSVSCSDRHHHSGTLYFYCRENLKESVVS